ncbi:MAG: anti-sigma factor [Deltaproteobacteria bacterium]|nr:anti-sigma factor [Deltaproteobacteria bacterium]
MGMRCADVQKLVHLYLDDEFEEADRALLERHLLECSPCREMVAFEKSFKSSLRARIRRPMMPAEVRARLVQALDRADATHQGPVPRARGRVVVVGGSLMLAAGLAIVVGTVIREGDDSAIAIEAIRSHEKNLPVEIDGSEDKVKTFFAGRVPVPVHPPRLSVLGGSLVGARIGHLKGRDAAQIVYRVNNTPVTVHVFDAAGLPMSAPRKRILSDREIFVDSVRGYNVVFFRDRGVGYAFTSDLEENDMLRLVSTSLGQ